jgi:hypothetical protein
MLECLPLPRAIQDIGLRADYTETATVSAAT